MGMQHTIQASYEKVRSGFVTSDDTVLDGITSGLTYKSSDRPASECWESGPAVGANTVLFIGNGAENTTFSWKMYGYRTAAEDGVGPAEIIAEGTGIMGTALAEVGTRYADTVVITNPGSWLDVPVAIDSGNDRICKVCYDFCGFKYLYTEFTNIGGGGGEVTSIQAYVAYF